MFSLFLLFLSYRRLQVVLDGKSSQKYTDNAGLSPASIFDLAFLLLHITDFPDAITCNISFQSMLMTPLSRLSVIKMVHLIYGNN